MTVDGCILDLNTKASHTQTEDAYSGRKVRTNTHTQHTICSICLSTFNAPCWI